MKERVEVSKPKYETPRIVTYGKEELSKLVGPVKGYIVGTPQE
jgi:hypothetical protein